MSVQAAVVLSYLFSFQAAFVISGLLLLRTSGFRLLDVDLSKKFRRHPAADAVGGLGDAFAADADGHDVVDVDVLGAVFSVGYDLLQLGLELLCWDGLY